MLSFSYYESGRWKYNMAGVFNDGFRPRRKRAVVINDGTRPKIKRGFRFRRDGRIVIVEVKIKNPRAVGGLIPFCLEPIPFY
jgi:hypothetical protein